MQAGDGPAGSGKPAGKFLLFIIKEPQFNDFFFFVEPVAHKSAYAKLFGERRQTG